jgi:hypothetical protein
MRANNLNTFFCTERLHYILSVFLTFLSCRYVRFFRADHKIILLTRIENNCFFHYIVHIFYSENFPCTPK